VTETVLLKRDGPIVTVTLNRPAKLNALDLATWELLAERMRAVDRDDAVRCVILQGAGDAFAAGADISEFASVRSTVEKARAYGNAEHAGVMTVAECRHPTVALIDGPCVGGGLEIACACDIRICSEESRFGVPINRLGLTMALDELAFFLGVVGRAAALEILLEGQVVGAARAQELGLVHRVVAHDLVEAEALATARRIASGAPLVNRWHKAFIRRLLDDPRPLTDAERAEGFAAFGTEDFQIGYRAFLNKVTPEFKGR